MTELLIDSLLTFVSLCIAAIFVQNTIFSRAIGISSLLTLVDDTTSTAIFGLLLTSVTTLGGVLNWLLNRYLLATLSFSYYLQPLGMVLCMSVSYLLVFVLIVKLAPYAKLQKAMDTLPLATFNCAAVGTLLVTTTMQLDLFGTICYSLGMGLGFVLAVVLVTEGQRKIQNDQTPVAFRGLPVTLLYIAGFALAVYGLLGYTFLSS